MRILWSIWLLLLLAGCGFHLREHDAFKLPVETLAIRSAHGYTPFIRELRRGIESNGGKILDDGKDAQLVLDIVSERESKDIITLSGSGRVLEYRLHFRVSLRAYDSAQNDWIPADEISLQRDFPYDDTQILAKEQEEAWLYQDMRSDVASELWRLSRARLPQDARGHD